MGFFPNHTNSVAYYIFRGDGCNIMHTWREGLCIMYCRSTGISPVSVYSGKARGAGGWGAGGGG